MIEALASYAHKAWSGWMEYLFEKSEKNHDGSVTIPKWAVDRWERQCRTEYENLPGEEQDSDRKEAQCILDVIAGCDTNESLCEGCNRPPIACPGPEICHSEVFIEDRLKEIDGLMGELRAKETKSAAGGLTPVQLAECLIELQAQKNELTRTALALANDDNNGRKLQAV